MASETNTPPMGGAYANRLMRVEHPSYTFGIVFERRGESWLVIEAAPLAYSLIARAGAARDWDSVHGFFVTRGARVTELPEGAQVCSPKG